MSLCSEIIPSATDVDGFCCRRSLQLLKGEAAASRGMFHVAAFHGGVTSERVASVAPARLHTYLHVTFFGGKYEQARTHHHIGNSNSNLYINNQQHAFS